MTLAIDDYTATPRHRAYLILEGGRSGGFLGHVVEAILITLIVSNVMAYTFQTIPSIDAEFSI